jgi:uncharacterized protein
MNALLISGLGLVLATTVAGAQTPVAPAAIDPPVVVVHGEGVVRKAPDQAYVRIGAESRARNPKEAQTTNAEAMSAVQQRLAAAGVAKDAVRTVIVSLQQEFDYNNGRQTPRGYVALNIIEVRVDDLARLGEVMDASVGTGATSLQGLHFDLKDREATEREALTRAVANAMARATAAAAGAKRSVDRVLRIDEMPAVSQFRPQAAAFRTMAADAAPPTTPVAEGELEIRAQVTLTAVIK